MAKALKSGQVEDFKWFKRIHTYLSSYDLLSDMDCNFFSQLVLTKPSAKPALDISRDCLEQVLREPSLIWFNILIYFNSLVQYAAMAMDASPVEETLQTSDFSFHILCRHKKWCFFGRRRPVQIVGAVFWPNGLLGLRCVFDVYLMCIWWWYSMI